MKVQDLLTDPTKWARQGYAFAGDGRHVIPTDPEATCWCLAGAVRRCYRSNKAHQVLRRVASKLKLGLFRSLSNPDSTIANWNDAPEREFADVQALVKELNI